MKSILFDRKKTSFLILAFAVFIVLVIFAPKAASAQVYFLDPQTGTFTTGTTYPTYTFPTQTQTHVTQTKQQQQLQIQQLLQLVQQLIALVNAQGGTPASVSGSSQVDITTLSASQIEDDRARLNGEVDFNRSRFAYLWFEWGEDDRDLDERTPRVRRDDDEDDRFSVTITRLDEDERYYFRAVGEDDRGRIDRGSIRSFTTDDDRRDRDDDEPDVETGDAVDITDDSAELEGEVDMNDFDDGRVFLVYGEDEDQISDIEDDYDTYSEIDEDGDDLQKILVDSSLDGRETYTTFIDRLDDDTEYFYAYCVEFEDDDRDDTITCGQVESFETDR